MRWLLDEMLPPAAAGELRRLGHDAVSVAEISLLGADDADVYSVALSEDRVIVTEDAAGFVPRAKEDLDSEGVSVPIALVHKDRLGRGPALARNLAQALHQWSQANPDPPQGPHWL